MRICSQTRSPARWARTDPAMTPTIVPTIRNPLLRSCSPAVLAPMNVMKAAITAQ